MKPQILLSIGLLLSLQANAQTPSFDWVKKVDGETFSSAIIAGDGAVYISGTFSGLVDFDPGPGIDTATDYGRGDIFICKMDTAGNLAWAHRIGGDSYDEASGMTTDEAGNIYVTGFFSGDSVDFDPGPATWYLNGNQNCFVLKLDPAGNFVWAKQLTGTTDNYGTSIATDHDGNILVTGTFGGTVDFDPGPGTDTLSAVTSALFFWKLDHSGNYLWARQIAAPLTPGTNSYTIVADNANNVLVAGSLLGATDFDPGPSVYTLTNTSSIASTFLLKLDPGGNFDWARQIDNTDILLNNGSIATDGAGNIYMGGSFSGTTDLDPGPSTDNHTATPGANHFVVKLDNNANLVWARIPTDVQGLAVDGAGNVYTGGNTLSRFDGTGLLQWALDSTATSNIAIAADGSIYSTKQFSGTVDFDPGPGVHTLSDTSTKSFVLKLTQNVSSGVPDVAVAENKLLAYPNPARGRINVLSEKDTQLKLINSQGQSVRTLYAKSNVPTCINTESLAAGTYFLSDLNGNKVCITIDIGR